MNLAHSRWLLAGLALLFAAKPSLAQLRFANDPKGAKAARLESIDLRPNVEQKFFFFYRLEAGVSRTISIKLEQVAADNNAEPVLMGTANVTVKLKENTPIDFKGVAPKDGAAWPKLEAPYKLRFTIVENENEKPVVLPDVPVRFKRLSEYITVFEPTYEADQKRLSFKLKGVEPLDPPCEVKLVMNSSLIPGLKENGQGTFLQKLSKDIQEVTLSADNVEFEGGVPPKNGRIYLDVDGFERAFLYKCAFSEGTLATLTDETRARLIANRYSPSSPKVKVAVEIDAKRLQEGGENALQDSLVEIKFNQSGGDKYQRVPGSPFLGLRDQSIEYKTEGPALVFKTIVKDRVIEINAAGINGSRNIMVQVLSPKKEPIALVDEQTSKDETLALFSKEKNNRFAPLSFDESDKAVRATIILDSTPVEGLALDNLPAIAKPEAKLTPRLKFAARDADKQAPIEKVFFYFGEADKDHKVPEKALKIDGVWDAKEKAYVPGEIMFVPADHRGKLFVGAQVETATGAVMSKKHAMVILTNGGVDTGEPDVLTTIAGKVVRSELGQPGVTVVLAKAKAKPGEKKKEAKTTDDGKFEFKSVEPGEYVIFAQRDNTFDRKDVIVSKNEKTIELELKLTVK